MKVLVAGGAGFIGSHLVKYYTRENEGFSPQEGEFKETRVFNLGNPFEHYSVKELALIVKEITGSSSQLVYQGLPKDDPVDRIHDISKAMKVLGWRPGISLREGLKRTLESMK